MKVLLRKRTAVWLLLTVLVVVVSGCEKTDCDVTTETLAEIKTAGFCELFTPKRYPAVCIDAMTVAEADLIASEESFYAAECH